MKILFTSFTCEDIGVVMVTKIRYLQRSKIKFLSPRGHVISSICTVVKCFAIVMILECLAGDRLESSKAIFKLPIKPLFVFRYHLQAFRHLYVLAAEPRVLVPREVDTNKACHVPLEVTLKVNSLVRKKHLTTSRD